MTIPMIRFSETPTEKQQIGRDAEDASLAFLQQQGLKFVTRNFNCRAGEIDLIMMDGDTLVFIEVRKRKNRHFGGAAFSVTPAKQRKIVKTAQFYLQRYRTTPPCRFDVMAWDGAQSQWLKNAIETI